MPRMYGLAAIRLLAHPATGAPIDVLVVTTMTDAQAIKLTRDGEAGAQRRGQGAAARPDASSVSLAWLDR